MLITLASIIAAAGVAADSTATVIGAMIVAPLMTPILGTMLSVVLADRTNLTRSLLHVAGGAVVAIAISLVPPLSVVGFTFEAGKLGQSLGASLLFLTNVAAILGSDTVVMALYGIHRLVAPTAGPEQPTINRRNAVIAVAAMVVAVSIPLAATSVTVIRDTQREVQTLAAARSFGETVGWTTGNITTRNGVVLVHMEGPPPLPNTDRLRTDLEERGVDPSEVHVELVPARLVTFD
jgi:uncharacterized membrane protein